MLAQCLITLNNVVGFGANKEVAMQPEAERLSWRQEQEEDPTSASDDAYISIQTTHLLPNQLNSHTKNHMPSSCTYFYSL